MTLERSNASALLDEDVVVVAVAVAVDVLVSVVVVYVVLALSSTTPDEDLLALHSNGQHQPSEQPLSGRAIVSNTPILISIFIMV